ncbi:MAG: hypothetical protein MPK62_09065 [Alphaproteobacteria bacterium]|nr:hypothetical protein [Alphaproteobacteria bacterium]MDA8009023.1 hypothetical protein [Alphaproteobacteria bacterium]MDA8031261.1 hypothetical protein [Alphaproteobacteria bacterium]
MIEWNKRPNEEKFALCERPLSESGMQELHNLVQEAKDRVEKQEAKKKAKEK